VQREYDRLFTARIERWLDAGHGACPLRAPEHAALVGGALAHFEGERYGQHAWIVMPNHVHALVSLHREWTLEELVRSWKIFSARRINPALGQHGTLWQKDYFDRIVRDEDHFWRAASYIRANPTKANLRPGEYLLWESAEVKATLDAEEGR
jgi:putative transposase